MIFDSPAREAPLDQGDIIEGCPVLHIAAFNAAHLLAGDLSSLEIDSNFCRVIVVTQTCDLANEKTTLAIVDLRQLHTVRLDLLAALSRQGKRLCRLITPYREHLSQHLATTYARIGLPVPYDTKAES